jgi:7-keto-8-aminopelargonate synthetase-like enzyme
MFTPAELRRIAALAARAGIPLAVAEAFAYGHVCRTGGLAGLAADYRSATRSYVG